jgi:hypothetical protein
VVTNSTVINDSLESLRAWKGDTAQNSYRSSWPGIDGQVTNIRDNQFCTTSARLDDEQRFLLVSPPSRGSVTHCPATWTWDLSRLDSRDH